MIPGAAVSHSIITPDCRLNRGDDGAWDEAVLRAKTQYDDVIAGWAGREMQPTLHLALTIERPTDATSPPVCRRCGEAITGRWMFGSRDTGWDHIEGECPSTSDALLQRKLWIQDDTDSPGHAG